LRIRVIGDAAARLVLSIGIEACIGVVLPLFLTRRRVDRDGPVVRRADEKAVAHLQRRDLIGRLGDIFRELYVAGLIPPDLLQFIDILDIDLIERRIALAVVRAPILVPFARRNGLPMAGAAATASCGSSPSTSYGSVNMEMTAIRIANATDAASGAAPTG
jgi:hypothetical protein